MKLQIMAVAIGLTLLTAGCGSVLGTQCAPGFVDYEGECVPEREASGATSGAGGQGGAGGAGSSDGTGGSARDVCAPGRVRCEDGCVDLSSELLDCGACDHRCEPRSAGCVNGMCLPPLH